MKSSDAPVSRIAEILQRLEQLRQDNRVCLLKSQEIIEKTKSVVLRSSKFL